MTHSEEDGAFAHEIENPNIDDSVITDTLFEEGYEEIQISSRFAADEDREANIIMDFVIPYVGATGATEAACRLSAKRVHDSFRARGAYSNSADAGINCSLGTVLLVEVSDIPLFANNNYAVDGIAHNGTKGVPHIAAYTWAKALLGTTGDGTRYLTLATHKISSTLGNGVGGFAYLGANATSNVAGNVSKISGAVFGSNILIHEMGHSFGLFHTFDNTSSCGVSDPETTGDRVADTPVQTRRLSDPCFGNNALNHMSYWSVRNKFTQGQVDRMKSTMAFRYPLVYDNPRYFWEDETPVTIPTVEISAVPITINQSEQVTVSWSSTNAESVKLNGEVVPLNGSRNFNPTETTIYVVEATRGNIIVSAEITVIVNQLPMKTITIDVPATGVVGQEMIIKATVNAAGVLQAVFTSENATPVSVSIPIAIAEPPVEPPVNNLILQLLAENFSSSQGWLDTVTNKYIPTESTMPTKLTDGVRFTGTNGLVLRNLNLQNYRITAEVTFLSQSNTRTILQCSKRSPVRDLFIWTWVQQGNAFCFDNSKSRVITDFVPILNQKYTIELQKDRGLSINGVLIAGAGSPLDMNFLEPFVIGNDPWNYGFPLNGIIHKFEIRNL